MSYTGNSCFTCVYNDEPEMSTFHCLIHDRDGSREDPPCLSFKRYDDSEEDNG